MRTSSLPRILACLFGAMLVLTGCTVGTGGSTQPTTEKRGPAGPVPAGLARFYGQSLTWGDCEPYATTSDEKKPYQSSDLQCARLRVPLDYAHPNGTVITLGLLRRKATGKRIGSLVVNPGGPGVSGMQAAAALAGQVSNNELGNRFDLVGFDPRGIGASQPDINCYTDAEWDRYRAEDLDVNSSPAGVARAEAAERDYAHKCEQRTRYGDNMLAHVGTRDVARDMDVLRSALGDKKLNYLGFSYGTRLGSAYAEQFPDNIRTMLLDGAVDPNQDLSTSIIDQQQGFQKAFNAFNAWCAKQNPCWFGKNPKKGTPQYQKLTRALIKHPLPLPDGRKLTYDDATTGTSQALYSKQYWSALNKGLRQLRQGNGRILMALADMYYERSPNGHYSTTQDANRAISCMDNPRQTNRAKLKRAEARADKVAPFLDDGQPPVGELDTCAFWPVKPHPLPKEPHVRHVPPTLTISTTGDPATPYQAGVNLAKALGGALLTNQGTQHTAFLQGKQCVDKIGIAYVVDRKTPPKGARC